MASRYTLRELMELLGHSSLQATERYVKLLPQPGEEDLAERLNDYLRARREGLGESARCPGGCPELSGIRAFVGLRCPSGTVLAECPNPP
jgi:hypothetical protein